jgi:N-acetylglucosaminyldiphosphoundecaprenol N-acetyl-beta-D-mannosaminyltransferase
MAKIMNILGIVMSCLSYEEMYLIFDEWSKDKTTRSYSLALINVNACVSALFDKKIRDIYNSADLIGIDSMPFLIWARLFYNKKSDRFYAPDLLLEISSKVKEKGYTYYLYGGYPDAPDKLSNYLENRFENIRIVGKCSPPFRPLTQDEDQLTCKKINDAHPDFLWVGLGSPKQDIWIHEHIDKIRGCILIPSGATFDFYSGRINQAPSWIRNIGFEWLFRLTQDFKRLWVRYTVYNLIFIFFFCLQIVKIIRFDTNGNLTIFGLETKFGNM